MKASTFSKIIFPVFFLCIFSCGTEKKYGPSKNYPKELPIPNNSKIAKGVSISLTSIPSRIGDIYPTLISLLEQTTLPEEIVIAIPKLSRKENCEYPIPEYLKNAHPFVRILSTEEDWGPNTKFIPIIQEKKSRQQEDWKIIVVDDDQTYPKDMVDNFLKWSEVPAYSDSALANRGHQMPTSLKFSDMGIIHSYEIKEPIQIAVVTGVSGYMIQPRFFCQNLWMKLPIPSPNEAKEKSAAYFVDDAWISAQLASQNISSFVIPAEGAWCSTSNHSVNAISGGNVLNDIVFENYQNHWPKSSYGTKETILSCKPNGERHLPCAPCRLSDGTIN